MNSLQIFGIVIAVGLIICSGWLSYNMSKNATVNERLFVFIVVMLITVWVIDNVIAIHTLLLTDEENKMILALIGNIASFVLGNVLSKKDKV